jgi:hypothetical protein
LDSEYINKLMGMSDAVIDELNKTK